ncbi:class II glutamine amidotransferase [Pseudoalteromonas sp.]|uniref:class II glutamine amidotransferase n=1 Tax=Pseudoalteromonas sp. TaxID=53249 RepID=UPI00356A9D1B
MCRFIAYKGAEVTLNDIVISPTNSLVEQSKDAKKRKKPLNGDGFGLSWYPTHDDPFPARFVSIEPAWSNQNLQQIASKVRSQCFFAHVRDASVGMPVSQANCHPFNFQKYTFMHNGRLDQFVKFRRSILNQLSNKAFDLVKGNTDSECIFALFLDTIEFADNLTTDDIKHALYLVIKKIIDIRVATEANTNAFINLAVSDGTSLVATRYATDRNSQPASLFYGVGALELTSEKDFSLHGANTNKTAIISSEPLTEEDTDWVKVERNHSVVVDKDNNVYSERVPVDYQT